MGFSATVREDALVNSARRCCVCREVGRQVEVHHIQAGADGGSNTLENAIVLCFRCHSEAGHYNARHPRGSSYSPSELRRHRDRWWALVSSVEHVSLLPGVHQQTSYKEHSDAARIVHAFLRRLNEVHVADTLWEGVAVVPGQAAAIIRRVLQEFGGLPPGHEFNAGVPEFVQLQRDALAALKTMTRLLDDLQNWHFDSSTAIYEVRPQGLLSSDREQAKRAKQEMAAAWRSYGNAASRLRVLASRDP